MENLKLRIYGIRVNKKQFLIVEGIALLAFIRHQRNELEMQKKDILDSIKYAKRIQSAILPPIKLVEHYLLDSFVIFKPKDIVAGDFYWIEKAENRIYFTAADCTGHGVPGAMISVMCSNALSKSVMEMGIQIPSEILDTTVKILEDNFSHSEEEVKDGMDLALCCLDRKNNILEYAGAYNPLYYIRDNELNEIKPDKQPVGRKAERYPFTNHTLDIKSGDCIYIFSDGYADQFGGPAGKKFMYKPFKELLMVNHEKKMSAQKQILEKTLDKWQGGLDQVDDICIIGLRVP
ncbi:PP2C family protein-serine/threonine phosphatase [Bacteroidota bacterium]